MFKKEYDVFIAYHGSYDSFGSKKVADDLYDFLVSKGIKSFYYPKAQRDLYKANIIDVMRSKTFVLVCNENLNIFENKKIDTTLHYELSTEIDAFYALTQFGDDVSVQDSKVLVCGDYYNKRKKGDESLLHELFANRTHYFFNNHEKDFEEIFEWICSRISLRKDQDQWLNSQISTEIKEVFAKRSSMSQKCNLSQMIASSKNVMAIGISNSELTIKIDPEAIKFALNKGAKVEIIFLDPDGEFTKKREVEEGLRPNRIKNITQGNIETALDLKWELPSEQKDRYRLFKYDVLPRMNIIIMDNYAILQYYANFVAGLNNPCFVIEKQEHSPLYDFCLESFLALKKQAVEILE